MARISSDKYDYSQIEYKQNKIKIKIICNIHGEFWQNPNSHLNGNQCHNCGTILKVECNICKTTKTKLIKLLS